MTRQKLLRTITTWCALLFTPLAFADLFTQNDDQFLPVEEAYQVIINSDDDMLELEWQLVPGYYLYQHRFKVVARNDQKAVDQTLTFTPGKKKYDEYFQKDLMVYYDSTTVTLKKPKLALPHELVLYSQACADAGLCYPPRKQYFLIDNDGIALEQTSTRYPDAPPPENTAKTQYEETSTSTSASVNEPKPFLPLILLGAFLGGLILNLMPCVFPVLSLKALSFASSSLNTHSQHIHGWAYTAGVVGSFVIAAMVIILGREAGEALGWGFQLQSPVFVAFMIYLFFVMGLSLSGLVEIGTQWMGVGQSLTSGHSTTSSFFTGVLAAVVASPCTAPFMASAIGFALTQSIPIAILVFITLGLGMAFPFLLLSYAPGLAKKLPAPGAWMETLKQFLAFPLYITCVWLLWVLGHQASSDAAAVIVLGSILIAFALWLLRHRPSQTWLKWFGKGLALVSVISAIVFATNVKTTNESKGNWQAFSPATLAEYRKDGIPVFIDVTADWCITCKVNERVALHLDEVYETANELGIQMIKADWTNPDPEIDALLNKYGRSGVPLYLMYPSTPQTDALVLPQILTKGGVIKAMREAVQ